MSFELPDKRRDEDEIVFDADELRAEISVATDEALELADLLVIEVSESPRKTPLAFQLARDYQMKRLHLRRLRTALKVEVAG